MKKIILLITIFLIKNKNNNNVDIEHENIEEINLKRLKEEITTKIQNLKTEIICEEEKKNTQIIKIKNDIENLEKELKNINFQIINTEIELLNLTFNKAQIAFQERNTFLENEIKLLQNTQDNITNKINEKKTKLEILNNKKTTLSVSI